MAGLVRRILDRAPGPPPTRAQRRQSRQHADDAVVMAWLREHGGIRPLEAFAVEVPLGWRRRQAALRRLTNANEERA